MTGDGDRTYEYDAQDRLVKITDEKGRATRYTYDSLGRRTTADFNGEVTKYYYLGESDQVSKEVRPDGTEISFTYNNDGSPLTLSYNGQTYYYVFNGHGDVIALTDANGTKVASYRYDPWGRELKADDETETDSLGTSKDGSSIGELNPYRYAGYIYDSKQQLYFLKTRYYEPQLGRFLSRDKYKGEDVEITPAAQNKYVYVNGNPVNLTDPTGQKAVGKSSYKPSKPKAKSPRRPKPKSKPKAKHDKKKASTKKAPKKAAVKKKAPKKKVPKKKAPKKKGVKKKVSKTRASKKKTSNKKYSKKKEKVKRITVRQKNIQKQRRPDDSRVRIASYNQGAGQLNKNENIPDITNKLNNLMTTYEERYIYMKVAPNPDRFLTFYNLVKNGAELDLKNQPGWESKKFIYNGEVIDNDAPGNIMYGYMGKVFGFEDITLYVAAGEAQKRAGTSKPEWQNSTYFGDDPRDQARIRQGINIYKQKHNSIFDQIIDALL